jgi:uncharacterized RDD family membrane protein YckC
MFEMHKINELKYAKASIWKKIGAFILDVIIINILMVSNFTSKLSQYFGKISIEDAMNNSVIIPESVYFMIFVMMILVLLYFTFFDYYLGQTPGKMIMKIKVIEFTNEGKILQEISFVRALVRNFYVLPFFPFYIFWIIEPIYLGIYNERLLERFTNTRTIDLNYSNTKSKSYKEYKLEKV